MNIKECHYKYHNPCSKVGQGRFPPAVSVWACVGMCSGFLFIFPGFHLAMATRKFSLVWESSWLWTSSWTEATLKSLCLFPHGGRSSPGRMFPSQVQHWEFTCFVLFLYFLLCPTVQPALKPERCDTISMTELVKIFIKLRESWRLWYFFKQKFPRMSQHVF